MLLDPHAPFTLSFLLIILWALNGLLTLVHFRLFQVTEQKKKSTFTRVEYRNLVKNIFTNYVFQVVCNIKEPRRDVYFDGNCHHSECFHPSRPGEPAPWQQHHLVRPDKPGLILVRTSGFL